MAQITPWLVYIHTPLMVFCMSLCIFLGGLGVLLPGRMAALTGRLSGRFAGRIFGLTLILVGAEMFIRSKTIAFSTLVRSGGVATFIAGGVFLLLPTAWIIITENVRDSSPTARRIAGIILLVFAGLFYAASRAAAF